MIAKVIKWSDFTSRSFNSTHGLYANEIDSYFGNQRFILRINNKYNCYEVIVEGQNPLPVYNTLAEHIDSVINESMKTLNCIYMVTVPIASNSTDKEASKEIFVNLEHRHAVKENKTTPLNINVSGSNSLLTGSAIKEVFKHWFTDTLSQSWYDWFVSYRWGEEDSKLVRAIVSCSDNYYCIGDDKRSIRSFLDVHSLPKGSDFKVEFVQGLLTSVIALPIVSFYALVRMRDH